MMSDTHRPHPEAEENSHYSLVDKILQIEHHRSPSDRSRIWFKNLTCLWTDTNHSKTLQIKQGIPYGCDDGSFIAVSYSSEHTPRLECDRNGIYIIIESSGGYVRRSKVRDVILRRILRYAKHKNVCRVWIDKECSPEEESSEKQTTMDSMNLLYRTSRHPIGLLAVILKTQSEVNYLQSLMMGHAIVRGSEDEHPRLANHQFAKKCATMLKTFGRYDIQYRFQHDARRRVMSPRIFADVQRRHLDRRFDRLPIIANSCNYAIRFISQKMSEGNHDLELCLLTMPLLNGEVLRDSRDIKKLPAEMDITNYMRYIISFNKFDRL
jgi:hypothetical protein